MIESGKGPKRVLAQIAGFDGAYMRFTGQVTRSSAPAATRSPRP